LYGGGITEQVATAAALRVAAVAEEAAARDEGKRIAISTTALEQNKLIKETADGNVAAKREENAERQRNRRASVLAMEEERKRRIAEVAE
jgi:hypothetical protein